MELSEEDYELMLNAAWSAFENTLKVWGLTDKQLDKFTDILAGKDGYKAIEDSLAEVIEWEEE